MLAIKAMMNFGSPVAKKRQLRRKKKYVLQPRTNYAIPKVTIGKKKNRKIVKVKDI